MPRSWTIGTYQTKGIEVTDVEKLKRILSAQLGPSYPPSYFSADTPMLGAIPELDSMTVVAILTAIEDEFGISIPDDQVAKAPYYHPGPDSEEVQYLRERRTQLGGTLPIRRAHFDQKLELPGKSRFGASTHGPDQRAIVVVREDEVDLYLPAEGHAEVALTQSEDSTWERVYEIALYGATGLAALIGLMGAR